MKKIRKDPNVYEALTYAHWVRVMKVKTALISVSDKDGIVDFSKKLSKLGIDILSTGGTANILRKAKLKIIDVSEVTGFPEMLDGRLKTLHPFIHGGILAKRKEKKHMDTLKKHGIGTIDLVVCNLYPFEDTIKKPKVGIKEIIENIEYRIQNTGGRAS